MSAGAAASSSAQPGRQGFVHSLGDRDLFLKAAALASKGPEDVSPSLAGPKRIAFMFLSRGPLPLAPFWEKFFTGHSHRFSLYIHTAKDFRFRQGQLPKSFIGRQIPSMDVLWGEMSMVDAHRRLLASALLEPANERFVLVSESCIPLYNFSFVYNYLMGQTKSFVKGISLKGSAGMGRWHPGFLPLVPKHAWRKGSQWIVLTRRLAHLVVSDSIYYDAFKSKCKVTEEYKCCCQDEHYAQTLLHLLEPHSIVNRTLTWVDWSERTNLLKVFRAHHISMHIVPMLRGPSGCHYNDTHTAPCVLFARKFAPDTRDALWSISDAFGF